MTTLSELAGAVEETQKQMKIAVRAAIINQRAISNTMAHCRVARCPRCSVVHVADLADPISL